ncbi:hypothetical protein KC318_g93 [Hortaea werneckii]|nr:hypothetical protein KC334_g84 [Hortaea werneckii]KAI7028061.1 hypothetical protein KC355_g92 [Hortaea werneckii]KAI7198351.1 hypothetical protein KC324_g3830 [Hortaea werneckii]KAI7594957.1 hypothetical protein KC316_g829 [Hortaea werneckii]KAI7676720.1 hypothetical protein KC318_g93 [Hortaea werneckii]
MASNQEKIALRNENLQKVLPFINSNRGRFSGRPAQEAALGDFLQGTSLFKFQNNTRVKVEHTGKTLRDQLRAALSSKDRSFEDLNVNDLFERGFEVFQPAFLQELGIGDTAEPETEGSTDQAKGQGLSDEQNNETRTGSTRPAKENRMTSFPSANSWPQQQAGRDGAGADSIRGSKVKPSSDGLQALPPNRKRKINPASEDHDKMPAPKSPRLQSQVSTTMAAPAATRKRRIQLDDDQEGEIPASKSPRLQREENGKSSRTQARMSAPPPEKENHTVQDNSSTEDSADGMVSGAQEAATTVEESPRAQPRARDLAALEEDQLSARPGEHLPADKSASAGPSEAHRKNDEMSLPAFAPYAADRPQQYDATSSRKRKLDAPDVPSSPKRPRTQSEDGRHHPTGATVSGRAHETERAAIAEDSRQPTVQDAVAGRVQAPLRNVRERHARAIDEPILEEIHPPEVEPAEASREDIGLLVLRQGNLIIAKCMKELEKYLKDILISFIRANNLDIDAASAFVRKPDKELEALYIQMFGSKDWEAAWLGRLNQGKPNVYRLGHVLPSLIGAAIYREVFNKELPWDVEENLYSRMGYASDALEEAMADRGHSFRTVVKHAQFKLLNSKKFQEETVKPHAWKVAETVAMTIAPHLKAEKRAQFPDAPAHYLEATSPNGEWVDQLRHIFELAYILKGKLNTATDAKYEYVWFKPGSLCSLREGSIVNENPYFKMPTVPHEVIISWLPAIKSEITSNRGVVEVGYCSPPKSWILPIFDSAGTGGTEDQTRELPDQRPQQG